MKKKLSPDVKKAKFEFEKAGRIYYKEHSFLSKNYPRLFGRKSKEQGKELLLLKKQLDLLFKDYSDKGVYYFSLLEKPKIEYTETIAEKFDHDKHRKSVEYWNTN